jgi:hypothetical protein
MHVPTVNSMRISYALRHTFAKYDSLYVSPTDYKYAINI